MLPDELFGLANWPEWLITAALILWVLNYFKLLDGIKSFIGRQQTATLQGQADERESRQRRQLNELYTMTGLLDRTMASADEKDEFWRNEFKLAVERRLEEMGGRVGQLTGEIDGLLLEIRRHAVEQNAILAELQQYVEERDQGLIELIMLAKHDLHHALHRTNDEPPFQE